MRVMFDGSPHIVTLGKRRKSILQVLLSEFTLHKNGNGLTLDVCVTSDLLSITGNDGKREFFKRLAPSASKSRNKIRKSLDDFYRKQRVRAYSFDCSGSPIRYANGGVLPVVRLDSVDYFCLFYRGIFPIGWNIANGGSDDLDELLDPERILFREFGEELLASDHKRRLIYVHEPGREDKTYGLTNEALEAWKHKFKVLDFDKYTRLSLPVKWIEGPDKVSARIGRRSHTSGGYFLNINPEDNSIELDRIALINLQNGVTLFDGEISRGVLCNRAIGLFPVSEIRRKFRRGKIDKMEFRPKRLFIGGEERDTTNLVETIRRECVEATPEILGEGEIQAFKRAPNKLNLCPVTRGIVERYFDWEKDESRQSMLTAREERRVTASVQKCEIFISFNSADKQEVLMLYDYPTTRGHGVFCSAVSLAQLGESDFAAAIGKALDAASCLIVFGTRPEHFESGWVTYEWNSFFNEVHSRRKANGKLFTLISGVRMDELPFALRQVQRIEYSPASPREAFEELCRFVEPSLRSTQTARSMSAH